MSPEEKESLVAAWIKLHKMPRDTARRDELFWSYSKLDDLVRGDPESAFSLILAILRADNTPRIEANLSAGPLEDLLAHHGPAFIDRIEAEAARDPRFRHLLGGVWQNAMTDEVWQRVQACWDRRGWDGIPE